MAKIAIDDCPAGEAMDTAIVQALGWRRTDKRPDDQNNWSNYPDEWYETPGGTIENVTNIPRFSTNIAAVRGLENALSIEQQSDYVMALFDLVTVDLGAPDFSAFNRAVYWRMVHASPLDRCRAFLKASGIEFVEDSDDQT